MTQPTTNHTTNHPPSPLPAAIPPRAHAILPPALEWPDLDPLACEIARLSTISHTITWHIAIAQAFLAISWEQSAAVEHHTAWRSWSHDLPKTASERHERARHNLAQAASCWSKVSYALSRALSAKRARRAEQHNPSYAMDDLEQCRAFARLVAEQQDHIEFLRHMVDLERLTTSITAGQRSVSHLTNPAESEGSHERS